MMRRRSPCRSRLNWESTGSATPYRCNSNALPSPNAEPASETLACFGYDRADLAEAVKAQLRERTNRGEISEEDAATFLENYTARLSQYTYLD